MERPGNTLILLHCTPFSKSLDIRYREEGGTEGGEERGVEKISTS